MEAVRHYRLERNSGQLERHSGSTKVASPIDEIGLRQFVEGFSEDRIVRCIMTFQPSLVITGSAMLLALLVLSHSASAQSKSGKHACSEANPAQLCTAANTCGSASSPCTVDVKRTANAASSTPGISNAKPNALFCVKVGTTVKWISTEKENGFVVDVGPSSPFDPSGAIIGGSDRSVSVVAKRTGCFKYSAGACRSGAIYGMCGTGYAKLIVTDGK